MEHLAETAMEQWQEAKENPFEEDLSGAEYEAEESEDSAAEPVEEELDEDKQEELEEDRKRAEHEAAEAKRKAEWEAKQQEKKDAEQREMNRLAELPDDEVVSVSIQRICKDTERLTRRNMKECVSEYVQTICLEDAEFARLSMHPRKNMINCFRYINRKAREYVEQEMKDNDIKPEVVGVYGSDIPDDLCYKWAEDYFRDPDAEEDKPEKEEKFVPKPYVGRTTGKAKTKKSSEKKSTGKKPVEKKQPGKKVDTGEDSTSFDGQMSLEAFLMPEQQAS